MTKMVIEKSFSEYVCLLIQYNICLLSFPKVKVLGIYNSSAQKSAQNDLK